MIARTCLSTSKFLQFSTWWQDETNQQAHKNEKANPPVDITLAQLMGSGTHFDIQAQLQFDDQLLAQVKMICLKAWGKINPPGQALISFTQIKQSNGEPYVDFIARLCQNLNKTVSQHGLRDMLMQVLAYHNPKSKFKKVMQTLKAQGAPLKNILKFARILDQNHIKCNFWLKHCLRLLKDRYKMSPIWKIKTH